MADHYYVDMTWFGTTREYRVVSVDATWSLRNVRQALHTSPGGADRVYTYVLPQYAYDKEFRPNKS